MLYYFVTINKIHMEKKTSITYQTMTLEQKKTFNKNHYKTSCKKRRDERKKI